VNVALLALVPLAACGYAAAALASWLVRAHAAAAPGVPPAWWGALPPVLLALAAGAWLGVRRAERSDEPLRETSRWLAAGAAGALIAPMLLGALLPEFPAATWRSVAAAWLPAAITSIACGVALVLLAQVRALAGGAAHATLSACALGVALGCDGSAPAALLGLPAHPTPTAAALPLALAGVMALLFAGRTPARPKRRWAPARAPGLLPLGFGVLLAGLLGLLGAARASGGTTQPWLPTALACAALPGLLARPRMARVSRGRLALQLCGHVLLGVAALIGVLGWLAGGVASEEAAWPAIAAAALALLAALAGLARVARDGEPGAGARVGLHTGALLAGAAAWMLVRARVATSGSPPEAPRELGWLLVAAIGLLGGTLLVAARDHTAALALRGGVLLLLVAGVLCVPLAQRIERPWRVLPDDGPLLAHVAGLRSDDTIVGRPGGQASVRQDGAPLLGEELGGLHVRRLGRIAAALKPDAVDAALLLRDDGQLLAALAAASPARITCVEPDAALIALQPEISYEPEQSARGGSPVLAVDDPRAWLLRHPRSLDLVVANVFRPDVPGREGWLTAEHFLAMRGALREDGVAVIALPLHLLPWPAVQRVGAAFLAAFPDARLFIGSLRADAPVALLAGGLSRGLPGVTALDELLAAAPSFAGINGAPDLFDLYVCDGWTLASRWRDEPPATLAQPWGAWLSAGRAADAPLLARLNLRLLADLAVPLETSSLQARPVVDKEDRRLGAELTARSAALAGLLVARSAQLALEAAGAGEMSADERTARETELSSALLYAWRAAPGHLDARDALLERAGALAQERRWEAAAALLDQAQQTLDDPRIAGVLGGLLLRLDQPEQALVLLESARARAPDDRSALVNLATALLLAGRDAEAAARLADAQRAFAPAPLPPLPSAALGLLHGDVAAVAPARKLLEALPADEPWARVLTRLLGARPGGAPR
jgi:Flp pilus assembly protein TadD